MQILTRHVSDFCANLAPSPEGRPLTSCGLFSCPAICSERILTIAQGLSLLAHSFCSLHTCTDLCTIHPFRSTHSRLSDSRTACTCTLFCAAEWFQCYGVFTKKLADYVSKCHYVHFVFISLYQAGYDTPCTNTRGHTTHLEQNTRNTS